MDKSFTKQLEFPDGFLCFPEFLSREEEETLIKEILKTELHTFTFQGFEAKRKVASFGYDKGAISKGKNIPSVFNALIEKVAMSLSLSPKAFAELLITEYPVGSVINWHRDAPPFELIAGISLLSDCKFRLRPYDKKKQTRASVISIPVQRRSLYILKNSARTDWQHSISPVKEVRYSITLRTLKKQLVENS